MEGLSCQAIADKLGKNPIDMTMDLLAEEKLAVTMISFYGSDEILEKVIGHPHGTVGSDGIYGGKPHPRLYGAYPCYFRRFVREKPLFSIEEAVRKVTSFPASILGLKDRGQIKENFWADLVVFDPDTISDRSTYDDPEQYPEGISYVIVNGEVVVEKGKATSNLPGKVLRHGK
jgi:N-acyl-D-amino-acid deacylase